MTLLSNYQRMMDHRLSKPKSISKVDKSYGQRVFKNSSHGDQKNHWAMFKSYSNAKASNTFGEDELEHALNHKTIDHLDNSFKLNLKRYNESDKVQVHSAIKQIN